MKKQMRFLFTAALLLTVMLCLCACSGKWEVPYTSLQEDGYNVSIRFDPNGGVFAGTNDVSVVDVYSTENGVKNSDGTVGFYLLPPDDPIRAEGSFSISKTGYFLAGWYTERTARVDANGNPLDDYGVPCSESGRPQGYTYSGRWNFEEDQMTVDPSANLNASQITATLYAGWIPYINYEFYAVDASTGEAQHIETIQSIDLYIPEWSEKTGKLDLKGFPERDGFTFDAAYMDADLTVPLTETIYGQDSYADYENGTVSVESVKIYTTWMEGTWFKIYTAEQFYNNTRLDGNYMICADLDFADAVWSPTLIKGKFTGKIMGNGHTFSNITAAQADNSQLFGGLFGALESGAAIQDLTFENVSFTIQAGSRMQGSVFGMLAGSVSDDATFHNVSISGKLLISQNCYPQSDYTIGLLCGSGTAEGVDYTIECSAAEDNTDKISIAVDGDEVTVTFHS